MVFHALSIYPSSVIRICTHYTRSRFFSLGIKYHPGSIAYRAWLNVAYPAFNCCSHIVDHWVAIAFAIPGKVLDRNFARSGPGGKR
jgi:hypothetical protein